MTVKRANDRVRAFILNDLRLPDIKARTRDQVVTGFLKGLKQGPLK